MSKITDKQFFHADIVQMDMYVRMFDALKAPHPRKEKSKKK